MASAGTLFTRAFIALSLAELAYFTALGLAIPVLPLFAAGPLGADEAGVGLLVGAFGLTALVLRPFAGRQADLRGRRPLLVGGALLCSAAMAGHAFTSDLGVVVGLRLLLGVAEAFFIVAGFAAVADLAPPGRAGEALSFNSLSLYLGIAIGPIIGEQLLVVGGFRLAWLGGAALALGAAFLALRISETARPARSSAGPAPLLHPGAVGPSLALFSGVAGMAGFFAFLALHARDLGLDGAGPVLFMFGVIAIGCRIVFAKLPDRLPPLRLGAFALALIAVGLILAAAAGSAPWLLVGAAVLAVGVAFATPAFFAAIFGRVRPSERGSASGTASLFLDLAFGGGPMVLGFVAGASGIPTAFAVAAAVAGLGACCTALAAIAGRRR